MKLKTSIVVLLSLVFLSSLFTPVAWAYQLKDTIALTNVKRPDTKICYHSSGKIIYAILEPAYSSSRSRITVYIYSSSLNKLGSGNVITGVDNYKWYDISIMELDNDEILIYGVEFHGTAIQYSALIAFRFNIVSFTFSTEYLSSNIWAGTSQTLSNFDGNLGSVYKYSGDNKFYVSGNSYYYYPGQSQRHLKMFIGKFDSGTNTITISTEVMGDTYAHPIYDFRVLDGIYDQYIYILTSTRNDDTAQFYVMNMSGFTLSFLTNASGSGNFIDTRRINLLSGGIYTSGNLVYLYFTWEYSYKQSSTFGYLRQIRVCQSRSVYNNTITNDKLLASGISDMIVSVNLPYGYETWSIGMSTVKENATIYYVNGIEGEYHTSKLECHIDDWMNYSDFDQWTTTFTAIADNDIDIDGYFIGSIIIYTPTGKMSIVEIGSTYIYLITPLYVNYDITLTYTPPDNPLLTDKSYLFTFTTYANGLPTALKYVAYFDGTQFGAGVTESNGQKQFTNIVSLAGIHITTIKIYDVNNVLVRTETFDHLYKKVTIGTDITEEGVLMIGINSMFGIIPSLIIIGLPALLFYQIKNSVIMVVVGMTLGSVIGVLGGVIPLYILFIIILCDLLIMFYVRGDKSDIGE